MRDLRATIEPDLREIAEAYETVVSGIDAEARAAESRAYGGIVRAGKGHLVESIARTLVDLSWQMVGGAPSRMSFPSRRVTIPVKRAYVDRIRTPEVRDYILQHLDRHVYHLRTDLHVHIDSQFCMGIECKAYCENAMLKRILVDFALLKTQHPELDCVLFELESMLGGDYSEFKAITLGSPTTHTLLSHFDVDLHIITLLQGERAVDRPIHRKEYYKPVTVARLHAAVEAIARLLSKRA
jgi:hypothetical protein